MLCIVIKDNSEISGDDDEQTEDGNTLLHIECAYSDKINANNDDSIKTKNKNGWTPFFSAAYANNQEAMNLLIYNIEETTDYFGNDASFYMKKK